MPDPAGGCCRCCCSFIFTLGLTALFMWLSLRASKPTISIQRFYLPALNTSLNSTKNTTLNIDLKLDNPNKDKGIYYDPINITFFYYAPNTTNYSLIANLSLLGFYQGHKKNARRRPSIQIYGMDWEAVSRAVSGNGSALFRTNLTTAVRYKIMAWKTKRHKVVVGADVKVNGQGDKDNKKGIKLKSDAPKKGCCNGQVGLLVFLILLNLL